MKICSKCKIEKPFDEFTKDAKKKDSVGCWCKICYNQYRRDNGYNDYSNRPEYTINYQRKLRRTEKSKENNKSYKKYYSRTFSGTITSLLNGAKCRAKNNDLVIDLDRKWIEEHLRPMKCEATGVDLTLDKNDCFCHSPFRPSIDRVDNTKGYLKENCRIVCVIFNKAKSDYSETDVIKMAKGLVEKCI